MSNQDNERGLASPQVGDYWHEMFCPYFIIVEVISNNSFRVLSCLGGPNSFNRKHEPNAKIDVGDGWAFDYDQDMIVNREWIADAVKYQNIDGFVADVVNSEKTREIANEWRTFHANKLRRAWEEKRAEWERFTGWTHLKEEAGH